MLQIVLFACSLSKPDGSPPPESERANTAALCESKTVQPNIETDSSEVPNQES